VARLELLGPFSGAVEDAQDLDGILAHLVWNDVRRSGDYQIAGAGDAADAARGRIGGCIVMYTLAYGKAARRLTRRSTTSVGLSRQMDEAIPKGGLCGCPAYCQF
jgi:hypothetical protein